MHGFGVNLYDFRLLCVQEGENILYCDNLKKFRQLPGNMQLTSMHTNNAAAHNAIRIIIFRKRSKYLNCM